MRNGIPNLTALQAFEASARLGSFSRAAEELSLTHSAVYRQVASLEARLGVQLFTRVRRRIVLTDHGAEYAGRIRHHLDQIEKDTFGLVSRTGMGRSIHIAVVPTLATTWLIPRLADFQEAHADITVSLSVRTLPFQFKDQPFDGALYHGDALWPGTQGVLLFPERELVPVCAPALAERAAQAAQAGVSVLAGMTHLHLASRPDAWRQWYGANNHLYGPQAAGGPRYELFTMVMAAVQAGLGVGLMPRFLAQPALDQGTLAMPVPQSLTVSQGYYFGYPQRSERSDALKLFETWLKSAAAGVGER
ncbi:LysR substrate-binding domain-containing protein [Achromobacter piechaudii]|uniref:Glycine cleavage system transcriptional activator n=2 Tax=Achromobacter piechaudii TaxID=72556 RepID=A0A6S7BUL9_9BURK|nr:LysR substrate-binding domain-containing protein [Achromobacter piechaudii]EFF73678.1 LysR substrate binding domain protein [Achromobacter piechaudii ATCC 43553]KNY05588.1 LysR family transcriptional regulator [Achromobacter piechaudii]CAB3735405.1 Glycine cleavage system transcriptional activator [Achromobacter piechaudii]CAB3819033.1 Glycine cleavage system transcriptional activator [Achromobacter piechaudii]CAB3916738.1 Glycine cleavage system transcriptional activator [Achromobacter pie